MKICSSGKPFVARSRAPGAMPDVIAAAMAVAIALLLAACQPQAADPSELAPAQQAEASALLRDYDAQRDAHRLEGLWTYQAIALGKGVQRSASSDSRTVPAEEGELAPVADAQLILRDHPDWGRSAYLLLAEKDFRCGRPCRLQLRFDDGAEADWAGKQADSGKGPALFVQDDARFLDALSKARLVRFGLPPGSGRIASLSFETGGFRRERYERGK